MNGPSLEDFNLTSSKVRRVTIVNILLISFLVAIFICYGYYNDQGALYSMLFYIDKIFTFYLVISLILFLVFEEQRLTFGYRVEQIRFVITKKKKMIKKEKSKTINFNEESISNNLSIFKTANLNKILDKSNNPNWHDFFSDITEDTVITCVDKVNYYYDLKDQTKYKEGLMGLKDNEIIIICDNNEIIKLHFGFYNKEYLVDIFIDKPNLEAKSLCRVVLIMNPQEIDYSNNLFEHYIFGMAFSFSNIFRLHFDLLSNKNKDKRKELKRNIETSVKKILKDNEVKKMCLNYLKKLPSEIFLIKEDIEYFEKHLIKSNFIGELSLWTTGYWLESIEKIMKEVNDRNRRDLDDGTEINYQINYSYSKERVDSSKTYKISYFDMVLEIMNKNKYFLNKNDCLFGTWLLLRTLSTDYFAEEWNQKYSEFFKDIDIISLDDCVKRYIDLNIKEEKDLGMFIHYLIKNDKFKEEFEEDTSYIDYIKYIKNSIRKKN